MQIMQNSNCRKRVGWAQEETELMWEEVRQAENGGGTLKGAFETVAMKTGRKPDSIRNFYYQSLKTDDAPEELKKMRAQPFVPFTNEDIQLLLREVLTDRAKGISVRACVHRLGGGDRALSLRYQNKYRSILKKRPDLIRATMEALQEEGIQCISPYTSQRVRQTEMSGNSTGGAAVDTNHLLSVVKEMLSRQDKEEASRRHEELDRMSVRCDLLRLELARRDERIALLDRREAGLRQSLQKAFGMIEACEELISRNKTEDAIRWLRETTGVLAAIQE